MTARKSAILLAALACLWPLQPSRAQTILLDPLGDAAIRRTDSSNDGDVAAPMHAKPDLVGYRIGRWTPDDATSDLYTGTWNNIGEFFRLDVGFALVANPPGPLAINAPDYDPYRYGPHPAFGWVEIDMDQRMNTGGETFAFGLRYLANVARFGGKPSGIRFANRVALFGDDVFNGFTQAPFVQRSGEEFHIALFGDHITEVFELSGNGNGIFEWGESWIIRGPLFHRAHGYEEFSLAGGPPPGSYEPIVDLRWDYVPSLQITLVSLVYPLTQSASAAMLGDAETEPLNGVASDQSSIEEALDDLIFSVDVLPANDPNRLDQNFPIISAWENNQATSYLNAADWDLTLMVGMAYVNQDPGGALCAWTDVQPNPVRGDFNGDGLVTPQDVNAVSNFITSYDGDGTTDGGVPGDLRVELIAFARNFSVYDLNYDGVVGRTDSDLVPLLGDLDFDTDVDFDDLAIFIVALVNPDALNPDSNLGRILPRADFNSDGLLDGRDIQGFVNRLIGGPFAPAAIVSPLDRLE